MKNTMIRFVLLIFVSTILLNNCEDIIDDNPVTPEDSTAAVVLVTDANALLLPMMAGFLSADPDSAQSILNDMDLSEVNGYYGEASELDWRNREAHFGLGFTSFLILSQNTGLNDILGSGVQVYAPFTEAGEPSHPVGYGFGLPLSVPRVNAMISTYFETPLALARLQFESLDAFNSFQAMVRDAYLPMLDAGIAALDSVDNDPEFMFTLGTEMQIELIDVIAMESSLYALQGFFKGVAAYNFELDTTDSTAIIAGLATGSTFGTLFEDGSSLLAEAHEAAWASTDFAVQVLGMVNAETSEMNHLLVDFSASESSQIESALVALRNALTGSTDVDYAYSDERGDFTIAGSASINIAQYYTEPVLDLKTLLPPYSVSTTTEYIYNQVTLEEQISQEEDVVTIEGLNNTPISIDITYDESDGDTTANVTIGLFAFDLLTANQSDLPPAIWDLWAEFLLTIDDYSAELYHYPEIDFHWSGVITTGASLSIDGYVAIDYLERTDSYTAPVILWSAGSYEEWLTGWSDPTANGMFPDFTAEDLAMLLGIAWE